MNIQELDIRCPHQRNVNLTTTLTYEDYHPLTYNQLVELLVTAAAVNAVAASKIQVRLNQAIPDMVCPRPVIGKISIKMHKLDSIFVRAVKEKKLTHSVVIDELWKLINREA